MIADLLRDNSVSAATALLYCTELILSNLEKTFKHDFDRPNMEGRHNEDAHTAMSLAVGFTPRPFRCVLIYKVSHLGWVYKKALKQITMWCRNKWKK